MTHYSIHITLVSDATFGTGSGVAGLLDREVEHDAHGFPFLRGRTLKGLLREEADNILFALEKASVPLEKWRAAHQGLFGQSGSVRGATALVHYGHAQLPTAVRQALLAEKYTKEQVLGALTAVRRQTALHSDPNHAQYGTPVDGSLRAMRVIVRDTPFIAQLTLKQDKLDPTAEALLVAAVHAWRRAGTGRNRGRGRLEAYLTNNAGDKISLEPELFAKEVNP